MVVWNFENAKHLLSRTLFGYSKSNLQKALSYSSAEAFVSNELLKDVPMPTPPGNWVTEAPKENNGTENGQRYRMFNYWWFERMRTEGLSMHEKMVLFLHNHFTTQRTEVDLPQLMYKQQQLFRKFAFGDFRQLTKDITVDPAMLIYLNGRSSRSRNAVPNENYAREVMELFTLGVGNYTENDIKEAAKTFAGWTIRGLDAAFFADRVTTEKVTIFGKTGNFTYDQTIDLLFEQKVCAAFICRKIFKEFVSVKIDEPFVQEMANILKDNNFVLKPVLQFLFSSDHFYEEKYKAARIKNPVELMIGALKMFEFATPNLGYEDVSKSDYAYIYDQSKTLQQQLFEPPNVAGWPGQRDWINSTTFAFRTGFTDAIVNGRRLNGGRIAFAVDTLNYTRTYQNSEQATKFVEELCQIFLVYTISESKKRQLINTLLEGTIEANYSTYTPMANIRLNNLYKAIMRLPEFQLC